MLIGTNVRLRLAEEPDLDLLAGWFRDPDFLGASYNQSNAARPRDLKSYLDAPTPDEASFITTDVSTGEPLGLIGYFKPFSLDLFQAAEIWYQVHPAHRGRGVARESASLLINHLFSARPINRVQATVWPPNEPSARVVERAGMTLEGTLRGLYFLNGEWVDLNIYGLTRAGWRDPHTYRDGHPF